jgi:hypothetical protein
MHVIYTMCIRNMDIMANCEENQHNLSLHQASINIEPTVSKGGRGLSTVLPITFTKWGQTSKNWSQAL